VYVKINDERRENESGGENGELINQTMAKMTSGEMAKIM